MKEERRPVIKYSTTDRLVIETKIPISHGHDFLVNQTLDKVASQREIITNLNERIKEAQMK